MNLTDVLGQIYAMRESIEHGWKPNQDQELALALADMLDEANKDADRYRLLRERHATIILYEVFSNGWEANRVNASKKLDDTIDAARSNHEPF